MVNIYKELDTIITDYVGYNEVETKHGIDYDCADPVLYDNLIEECTKHIREEMPYEYLSKDARYCIDEWTSLMQHHPLTCNKKEEENDR